MFTPKRGWDSPASPEYARSPLRIGLRVLSNPMWRGGINYIVNWSAALNSLPADECPEIVLLPFDEAGEALARDWPVPVQNVAPFAQAGNLDLDFVYPATQIFEAPFGAPWAGWIPDWQCKYLPEMFSPLELARRDLHFGLLAGDAPVLVLSSQMALEDTKRLVPEMTEAHVLPFPALLNERDRKQLEGIGEVRRKYDLPERYLIVCNQFWRHKNHRVVLEALAKAQAEDILCVMTGEMHDERWPDYINELKQLLADEVVASRVRLLGSISRDEQLALMGSAVAIVQPSLFEGWSTVVEEARLLGTPSLLSDFPVHREQSPPGSCFFDPHDANALARLLDEAWSQEPDPDRLIRATEAGRDFSVQCARKFMAVAGAAKRAYRPETDDPAAILARLVARLEPAPAESVEAELEGRVYAGIRAMLKQNPEALDRFLACCEREGPEAAERARKHVASVLKRNKAVSQTVERVVGPAATQQVKTTTMGVLGGIRRMLGRLRKTMGL